MRLFIVGDYFFIDKFKLIQVLVNHIFLEICLIGQYSFIGDHQKEMAIQVGSQANVQLFLNILIYVDFWDLKVDPIIPILPKLILEFTVIRL